MQQQTAKRQQMVLRVPKRQEFCTMASTADAPGLGEGEIDLPSTPTSSTASDTGSESEDQAALDGDIHAAASAERIRKHGMDLITGAMPPTSITAEQLGRLKRRFDAVCGCLTDFRSSQGSHSHGLFNAETWQA